MSQGSEQDDIEMEPAEQPDPTADGAARASSAEGREQGANVPPESEPPAGPQSDSGAAAGEPDASRQQQNRDTEAPEEPALRTNSGPSDADGVRPLNGGDSAAAPDEGEAQGDAERRADAVVGPSLVSPFPDALIRRVMRQDDDVSLITAHAVKLVSRAAACFLESLGEAAFSEAQRRKRKTMQEADVIHALTGRLAFRQCVGTSLSAMKQGIQTALAADTTAAEVETAPSGKNTGAGARGGRKRKERAAEPKSRIITAFFNKS